MWSKDSQTLSACAIPAALQYQILAIYNIPYMSSLYQRIFLPIRQDVEDYRLEQDVDNIEQALKLNSIKLMNQSIENEQNQSSISKWAFRLIKTAGHA